MTRRRIEKIPSTIATLGRRADYLHRRLEEHRGPDRDRDFDRRELRSLRAAIQSLEFTKLIQRPESDPLALLEELIDAIDHFRNIRKDADEQERAEELGNLLEVQARAKSTIALADALLAEEAA
jgi:hypothetical protein